MHRRVEKVSCFGQRVVMAVVFATLVWMGVAQEAPAPPPAPTHQDAPAPEPNPELKPLLEEILNLLNSDKFQDALPKTDELLQGARAKGDKIGEAYALRFRAIALQQLRQNTPEQLPEVASVWASALGLWREIRRRSVSGGSAAGSGVLPVASYRPSRSETLLVKEALGLAKRRSEASVGVSTRVLHSCRCGLVHEWGNWAVAEQMFAAGVGDKMKNLPPTRWIWQVRSTIWEMWLTLEAT
jgi:hypothetical protein